MNLTLKLWLVLLKVGCRQSGFYSGQERICSLNMDMVISMGMSIYLGGCERVGVKREGYSKREQRLRMMIVYCVFLLVNIIFCHYIQIFFQV